MSLNHHNKGGIDEVNGSTNEVNVEKKEKKRVGYGRRAKKVVLAKFRKAKKRFLSGGDDDNFNDNDIHNDDDD
ncbi:hypothetical protein Tco_0627893 [Tanacetum coccineum]|uniref:Uncharacterized protein n=1 Tax=Tanacetum coccineum TaxID=301880 RepID=A0ABQ4WNR4_9ASTR